MHSIPNPGGFVDAFVPNPSLYDGETVTTSVYLRSSASSGSESVNMYLIDVSNQGWSVASMSTLTLTPTWQRFQLTSALQNGLSQLCLQVGNTLTSGQGFEIWGAQFSVGTNPAPYTATSSSTTVVATGAAGTLVPNGLNQVYAYDSFGNILQNGSFNSTYTASNQMFGYPYDAAGNQLSNGLFDNMTWDAESRMTSVGGATYVYDAEGNRVEKQGATVTDTIYFAGQPIARLTAGQWTDLIYGPSGLLAEVPGTQAGSPVYRLTDNLGTGVGSLLANGNFVDAIDHSPFGQVVAGTTNDPYFFTGKERDAESGLDYFGARYYGSNMGRWMSPDWSAKEEPVPYAKLDDPQSLNLYGYVGNNPLSRADADGHCFPWCFALAGGGALEAEAPLATLGPVGWGVIGVTAAVVGGVAIYNHFHQEATPAAATPGAKEQPRTADGKFAPKEGGEANPGAAAEATGLGALGATKNTGKVDGTVRDGTVTATGEHAEIKSGTVIANTKQLAAMGATAVAKTGKPLVVGATHPNVTVTRPAQQNPDLNIKKIPQ